jgi:hypothetical protein
VNEAFAQSLRALLVVRTTETWMFWFGLLEAFAKEHGHCRVSQLYETEDGYPLGRWVEIQRKNKDKMDPERTNSICSSPSARSPPRALVRSPAPPTCSAARRSNNYREPT